MIVHRCNVVVCCVLHTILVLVLFGTTMQEPREMLRLDSHAAHDEVRAIADGSLSRTIRVRHRYRKVRDSGGAAIAEGIWHSNAGNSAIAAGPL